MHILLVAIISIILSVAAQFLLKLGMSSFDIKQAVAQPLSLRLPWTVLTNKFVFSGFALYGLGAVVWLKVLSTWDVSKAYPLVGLGLCLDCPGGYGSRRKRHRTSCAWDTVNL